jgi:hypothetical protein
MNMTSWDIISSRSNCKESIFAKTHLCKDISHLCKDGTSPQRHHIRSDVISANADLHSIGTMMGFHAVTLWQNETFHFVNHMNIISETHLNSRTGKMEANDTS